MRIFLIFQSSQSFKSSVSRLGGRICFLFVTARLNHIYEHKHAASFPGIAGCRGGGGYFGQLVRMRITPPPPRVLRRQSRGGPFLKKRAAYRRRWSLVFPEKGLYGLACSTPRRIPLPPYVQSARYLDGAPHRAGPTFAAAATARHMPTSG